MNLSSSLYLSETDFRHPDKMSPLTVSSLDRMVGLVGSKPNIISDWRPYDPESPNSRHYYGDAVDTAWPGVDPLTVLNLAFESQLWTGIGIYLNDQNAVSFHFDNRPGVSPTNPSKWGAFITHPYDPLKQANVQNNQYTTMQAILDVLKKKGIGMSVLLITFAFAIYLYMTSKRR